MKKILNIYTILLLIIFFQFNCIKCYNNKTEKKLDEYTSYLINDALTKKKFPLKGIENNREMMIFIENLNDCYYDNEYFKEFVIAYFFRQYYFEKLSGWHFDIRCNNTSFDRIMTNEYIKLTNTKNDDFITSVVLIEKLKGKNKRFNNKVLNRFYKEFLYSIP